MRAGLVTGILTTLLAASPAAAQTQNLGVDAVQAALRRGDRVQIVTRDGAIVGGAFDGVSGSVVRIVRQRTAVDVALARIDRVRRARREGDGVPGR
jgi:hypothetical protein